MRCFAVFFVLSLGALFIPGCSSKSGQPLEVESPNEKPAVDSIPKVGDTDNPPIDSLPGIPPKDNIPIVDEALHSQATAWVDSGLQRAMNFAKGSEFTAEKPLEWVSKGKDSIGFGWSIRQFGLFRRVFVHSRAQNDSNTIDLRASAMLAQKLELDDFPALALTSQGSNVVLAMDARITGPVLLATGGVRLATHAKVRYYGNLRFFTTWDKTASVWSRLPLQFPATRKWNAEKVSELEAMTAGKPDSDPAWDSTEILSGPFRLKNIRKNVRLFVKGELIIGSGSKLVGCQVVADAVVIEGNAVIDGGVILSAGKMTITGEPSLKGQFISRDTLTLAVQSELVDYPVFYAEAVQDSMGYQGGMRILEARGQGIFLVDSDAFMLHYTRVSLFLGANTDLTGLAATDSYMDPRGVFRGSVIAHNLHFQKDGTTWISHLGYADLGLAAPRTVLNFPGISSDDEPTMKGRHEWLR